MTSAAPGPGPGLGRGPAVILLVDDNADDVFLTRHAFSRSHLHTEIIVARDGVEALDLLLPEDGREQLCPAIVLLDINMPRLGGLEVLAGLRADPRTRSLPVIMLTASSQEGDLIASYDLGANSFVPKPVEPAQFLAAGQTLGVYWLGVNKPGSPPRLPDAPSVLGGTGALTNPPVAGQARAR